MADPVVFSNAFVGITTSTASTTYTELSGNKDIQMPLSKAELANSVMGDVAETFFPGIMSAPLSLTYRQDFSSATIGVDALLWGLFNGEKKVKIKIRPVDAAVSTTNPSYLFSRIYCSSITPLSGSHGQLLENKAEFRLLSLGTLTRSTAT